MYQTGDTIDKILGAVHRNDLVLPAIQREFVWRPQQICRLFDSLMQGYPFGTFLYWRVEPENSTKFKFYDFVREYHQRDRPHCPPLPEMPNRQLTAVLDGQQRLTALNIGLCGSAAWKLPHKWWKSPDAFPKRKLHLDLLWQPDTDEEDGVRYKFAFLTEKQFSDGRDETCWFPVANVRSMQNAGPAMTKWLNDRLPQDQVTTAHETLYELYQVVHNKHVIAHYEETGQELDKALQIFIRLNDGGTPLAHSDLLLSIAVAQWTHHDAREEIHALVDHLNAIGDRFTFSKDLILKAGLMLSDIGSVGFRVANFDRDNMAIFEANWTDIKRALTLTVELIASFGFAAHSLTAHNAILPIAYYVYNKRLDRSFLSHSTFSHDRAVIREWLIRTLLKSGVWGSGLDTLLTEIRRVIAKSDQDEFPARAIRETMARRGRQLTFDEEEIEDLVDMRCGGRLTFALLSLLFPFVSINEQYHVDHIFPASRFTDRQLRCSGVSEEEISVFKKYKDGLPNLQLLRGALNIEKSDTMPAEWLTDTFPNKLTRQAYEDRHLLGCVPQSITEFETFYETRREQVKQRIGQLLGRYETPEWSSQSDSVSLNRV